MISASGCVCVALPPSGVCVRVEKSLRAKMENVGSIEKGGGQNRGGKVDGRKGIGAACKLQLAAPPPPPPPPPTCGGDLSVAMARACVKRL